MPKNRGRQVVTSIYIVLLNVGLKQMTIDYLATPITNFHSWLKSHDDALIINYFRYVIIFIKIYVGEFLLNFY